MNETISRAGRYIWATARVLEQHRFEHLYGDDGPEPIVAALDAYRTPDGGFGYALEPDGRGPTSQPPHVWAALEALHDAGAVDGSVCAHLETITAPDGGVPLALPTIEPYPHAPWWSTDPGGSLIATGNVVAHLIRHGVEHPWVTRATEFCWAQVDAIGRTHPYEVEGAVVFLDAATDRARAEQAAERLGTIVREQGLLDRAPEGYGPNEIHRAYDYAPRPDSVARRWFSDAEMEAALDELEGEQGDDGGWPVKWPIWTPATAHEWGPIVTLRALNILRAYGRI